MNGTINFSFAFPVIIGLALFLFGMSQLEKGIRTLGYDTFKRMLSRSTASPASSAATGVFTTAILQSSSLVSLLVLAFASAGVLPLYNAIGIILGANLGTTMTGWIVATIGFKLSLQTFALPLMALGGAMQLSSEKNARLQAPGIALFGLGLVIFGLDVMKTAVEHLPDQLDASILKDQATWVYFILGVVVAAILQSSSATMMMTLALLNAALIDLHAAAAIVIGANLGTTSTTALGSIGGHYIKRQLALAHFIFNVVVDIVALFVLLPLLPAMLALLSLTDPLYSLVAFHSLFNLLGLLFFLPTLKPYSRWVAGHFDTNKQIMSPLLGQPTSVPDAALVATGKVLANMRLNAILLDLHAFHLTPGNLQLPATAQKELETCSQQIQGSENRYNHLKQLESDLIAFFLDLKEEELDSEQVARLEQQSQEARALVYSSKTLNDIRENLVSLRHSDNAAVIDWYKLHRNFIKIIYRRYIALANGQPISEDTEELDKLLEHNENHYRQSNETVNHLAPGEQLTGIEISTMLNVNREIHHSIKNLLLSLKT